ncbi:hypothetical protein [Xanthomonas sacchari]|uniref:hypothetical protein n=1 Tax=Xanthomonas sacchari TaxID=56458 RepID=UPI00225DD670|nr:hypothetical protein [Xanthomonas sacchari]
MSSTKDAFETHEQRDERFFKTLKDMKELIGSWTLGAAVMGAGTTVAASDLAILLRIIGALACTTVGLMLLISGVLIFSRERLAIDSQPIWKQKFRILAFVTLMVSALSVSYATMEILRKAARPTPCAVSTTSHRP